MAQLYCPFSCDRIFKVIFGEILKDFTEGDNEKSLICRIF